MDIQLTPEQINQLKLLQTFHLAERSIRNGDNEIMGQFQLTPSQFYVLNTLYQFGPLHIGEIIGKILSTSGNMTVVIRNMEKSGLIERVSDSVDKRSYLISLTEFGKKQLLNLLPEYTKCLAQRFRLLTDEDQKTLQDLLEKLIGKEI